MKRVVLLSGGIDSLVCAELDLRAGRLEACVFVDYGHPAQIPEAWKAFAWCGAKRVPLRVVHAFGLNLGDMGSAKGARVVPNRNAVLLSLVANLYPNTELVIGCTLADFEEYPDCRPAWLDRIAAALGAPVVAPLAQTPKAEVIGMARGFGLDRSDAWSCYEAGPVECGTCPSCQHAQAAWST